MGRKKTRPPRRMRPDPILIVVEGSKGKSEQTYFELLNQTKRFNFELRFKVVPGSGGPSHVMKAALKQTGDYSHICLVMDVDEHKDLSDVIAQTKYASTPSFSVVTNPQFELWLLWHSEDQKGAISKNLLEEKVKKANLVTGKRGKELHRSFPIENVDIALKRAIRAKPGEIGDNPSSAIPWLIEALISGDFSVA